MDSIVHEIRPNGLPLLVTGRCPLGTSLRWQDIKVYPLFPSGYVGSALPAEVMGPALLQKYAHRLNILAQ